MNLLGDSEEADRLVLNDGIIFPAVPMPEYNLHELVGAIVAQIVLYHLFVAHVLGFAIIERGDNVPGRASLGHQIERREQARDMEWFVIACRIGCAEPKSLGRLAHDREHGDRIHLHAAYAVANRMIVVAPEVPTMAEAGVPGVEVSSWSAFFVPARTPQDIVRKIHSDTVAALAEPAVREKLEQGGIVVIGSTPDELASFLNSEMDRWGRIIKAANIRAQ